MKVCQKCNCKISDDEMGFCPECGVELDDTSEELGEQEVYKKTIELLINDRTLASKIECNLNILPPHTMGGKVWYNELFEYKGWHFQQNVLFKYVRLLDDDDNCIAWGDRKQLLKKCRKLLQNI